MLKTIRKGEKTTRQRGLLWAGMWKQQNTVRRGNRGDIESGEPTTARAGDQVKEIYRPNWLFQNREKNSQKNERTKGKKKRYTEKRKDRKR